MKRLKSKISHYKPAMSAGIGCVLLLGLRYVARADAPKTLGAWLEQVGKVAALPVPATSQEIGALPAEMRKSEAASLLALGRSTIDNFVNRRNDQETKYGSIINPTGESFIYPGSQGYYPRLLAAICYYRAALLLKDEAQRADAFANVVDLLLPVYKQVNGIYVADKDVFNDIYNTPIVLRMFLEGAISARQGGLRFNEPSAPQTLLKWLQTLTYQEHHSLVKVDKTTVESLAGLLGPDAEKLHPGAADLLALGVKHDQTLRLKYLVDLRDGTKRDLLAIMKGAHVSVKIAPEIQNGTGGKVLNAQIHLLLPMNVAIVDVASGRNQDKTQAVLTSDQSLSFILKDPQVEQVVARWTVEDNPKFPIGAEYRQVLNGQTLLRMLRLKQKDLTPLALQIQPPEREAVADLRANHEIDVKAPILDTKAGALGVMLLDDADQPLDSNGNPLPANQPPAFQIVDANTVRQNNNTIKLSVGNLQPGSYRVKVAAWENARPAPNLTPGATQEKSLKVLGPGVALIVANDYYNDPDHLFPPLRHAVHDGRAIKQLLHKLGYLDDNIIYVFGSVDKNGQSHLDTNWCPDRLKARLLLKYHDRVTDSLINDAIGTLTQRASDIKATHALIFYAGHGKTFKAEGASFAENRFVCWHGEAAGGDKVNWSYVQVSPQQAVPDLVHDLTAPPGADKPTIIGIYDACRNAGNNVQVVDPPPPAGVNFFSLYSCGSSEQANEDPDNDPKMSLDIHHGFFTYALLQEFANAEKAGKVDILTLGDVVKGASAELNQLTQSAEAKWKDVVHYFHPQHLVDVGDLTQNQKPLPVFVRIGPPQEKLIRQEQALSIQ
jgi:hypothetical protein